MRGLSDFFKCKLCGSEIDKYEPYEMCGHIKAIVIFQKLRGEESKWENVYGKYFVHR